VAIFHLSVKTISRSAGRSATAAAAYRAGVEITDERTGEIHDYRRKAGVESAAFFLPAGAPEWATDRAQLWNAAEVSEKRKNSTVAREFEVALPAELSADQRRELAHEFARELVKRHGFAVDVAIHAPGKNGDHKNHHAHMLCTTRKLTADGFTEKTRELDDRATGAAEVTHWREQWAALTNAALERAGHAERIDHRSLEAQGIDREPTIHLGPAASAIERRGEVSQKTEHHQERQAEAAGKVAAATAEQARAQSILLAAMSALAAQRVAEAVESSYREQITQKEKEDDRVRNEALSLIDSNVAAASRAGAATDKSAEATGDTLAAANKISDRIGRNTADAEKGAERRQLARNLDRCAPAVGEQLGNVERVIREVSRILGNVVRTIARAAQVTATYTQAKREIAAERQLAAQKLDDLITLRVETRSAKEVWAASRDNPLNNPNKEKSRDIQPALAKVTNTITPPAKPPEPKQPMSYAVPFDMANAQHVARQAREDAARLDVNRQAAARGMAEAVPYPQTAFCAAHYSSYETAHSKAAREVQFRQQREPRPAESFFNKKEIAAYDAKTVELKNDEQRWVNEIKWRDAAFKAASAARQPGDAVHIAAAKAAHDSEQLAVAAALPHTPALARTGPLPKLQGLPAGLPDPWVLGKYWKGPSR
jgi:hypothetical protein